MKKLLLLHFVCLLLLVVLNSSCSKKIIKQSSDVPSCINTQIAQWHSAGLGTCESGNAVKQYTFQNKTVYVFEPGNCGSDMATLVYDSDCKQLGFLGGIVGNTKINDEEFANAVFVKTVWSN